MTDRSDFGQSDTTLPAGFEPFLKEGDKLADRFVIVQFLAKGGMGEVYEVADLHLQGKHHALKILRSQVATSSVFRRRFEREVLLARDLNHPNVCPTYDLFHVTYAGKPLSFLTMKLLRGESLLARLRRSGRMDAETVKPIAKQLAAALDAAHCGGVIHRDFKPGNVMLEGAGVDVRVVITDFGLSKAFEADGTLAETGEILGTPGYIAPEVVEGRLAAFTADIYAFGVVLYEMLTGQKPKRDYASRRVPPPSDLVPGLPTTWDKTVLGCLEREPERRFQSAGEALSQLESDGIPSVAASSQHYLRRPLFRRLSVALIAFSLLLTIWLMSPRLDRILHPLPQKRFVALMMQPDQSDSAYLPLLRNAVETIESRLARVEAQSKDLLVISSFDVTPQSALAKPEDAPRTLGANLVLTLALGVEGDAAALTLSVIDASNSRVLRKHTLHVPNSELSSIPDRASTAAANLLDVTPSQLRWKDADELATVPPAAYQLFANAESLAAQINDAGLNEAITEYQKAIQAHPRFALAYAKLAMTYREQYLKSHDSATLTLAERNADLALRLNKDSAQALLARAWVDVTLGNTDLALDGLKKAIELDPTNPQTAMAKARVYRNLDRVTDEEAVYRQLIANRPNFWPAYLELGLNLNRQGQYKKAADVFSEGIAIAPRVIRLVNNLGSMQLKLGMKKEAEETYRHSVEIAPTEVAYLNIGTLRFEAGDHRQALDHYEKAAALNPKNEITWRNIADCYAIFGDAAKVSENYAKASDVVSESLKINPKNGTGWMNLAFYNAKLGHGPDAERAMRTAEENGASGVQPQFKKVQILALIGRKDDAIALLLECIRKGLSKTEVDLALDLNDIRRDPQYLKGLAQLAPTK